MKTMRTAEDWKGAIREALDRRGTSRYAFIRECVRKEICSIHTGECLLADPGSVSSDRVPGLLVAIAMAEEAGLELRLVRKGKRRG
jgi:hypothetical protein